MARRTTSAPSLQPALSVPWSVTPCFCESSAAISAPRVASREPMVTRCPALAQRRAMPRPSRPVPPTIPMFMMVSFWFPRAARVRSSTRLAARRVRGTQVPTMTAPIYGFNRREETVGIDHGRSPRRMERLTGLDASFLYLETPKQHMHVAMAAVLDPAGMPGGYSFEKIQRLIASKVPLIPPLRRRLVEVPFALHHPIWIDDPNFDIIHHVRRVACPAPGTEKEFGAMCGRITSTPLDRSRPLWELWVVEGLEGGKFALVAKVHHAAVDGQTGAGLLIHFFSLTPDAPEPPPPPPIPKERIPTDGEMVEEAIKARLRQPAAMWKLARKTFENVSQIVQTTREHPEESKGAIPMTAPRCPWNGSLTAKRNAAMSRLPLSGIKEIKNAFGCTVNDVILAIASGTLRRYLEHRGELPETSLIACCPISVSPIGRA